MVIFKCEIEMDNEAFEDPEELRRLLVDLGDKVVGDWKAGNLRDLNGNRVGEWSIR